MKQGAAVSRCSQIIYFVCEDLYSALLADGFVCLIHCLELLLGSFLYILSECCYLVWMILYGHLTLCLLHLLIGCVRLDLQDAVVTVVAWSELCKDGVNLCL